ncbi:DNA repair protein RAD51 homolog 3 [Frankliniella occidentalis]|uniref:DNA repair protein RAD51 homolog 3 n=1 Tax=Frankliniella occidentalis TaxID=133901 RepID=A0A6J1T5D9_FRAOC|nr:DNA repair protein RAD51 homolog 3 [Frankliniella occidentalis]
MFRPISTLPLPASAQLLLRESGFLFCEDVISHRGVAPEARSILQRWNLHSGECWNTLTSPPQTLNSLDLWQEECTSRSIVTWSKDVDSILDGGIPFQVITELCGAPGSGKTQMSLQLCVDVQIPESLGGAEGQAVFIDTACNFSSQRIRAIADACCKHCHLLSRKNQIRDFVNFNADSILNNIHLISIHGIVQLLAAVKVLPQLIEQHPQIKLVVIDSLAFPFTCGETCNTLDRTSYIYRILSDLQKLAVHNRLAIVITNQLTTRIIKSTPNMSELSPALGESLGHRVTQRLLLGRIAGNLKAAIVLKGNNQCMSSAKFQITEAGIRDL